MMRFRRFLANRRPYRRFSQSTGHDHQSPIAPAPVHVETRYRVILSRQAAADHWRVYLLLLRYDIPVSRVFLLHCYIPAQD
jgi:hypothetical protein